ncbi:hypothetical protein OAR97_02775 [Arcobacteraceae bacterium]|jgi:hypothetical protein|nr:hypothetical protein [Arcobacteraceae bacterium]
MILNRLKKASLLILTALLLSACTPKDVIVYQQEDELLNCRKLTGKIAELMNINNEVNLNTGLEKPSLALWYFLPLGGVINQINASESRNKIDDRFSYLINLKARQNCEFTDKEREFAKLNGKGRFSERLEQWSIDIENRRKEMESNQ